MMHLEVDLRVQRRVDPLHRLEDPGRRRTQAEATAKLRDGQQNFARGITPGVPARVVTFEFTVQPNLQVKINHKPLRLIARAT